MVVAQFCLTQVDNIVFWCSLMFTVKGVLCLFCPCHCCTLRLLHSIFIFVSSWIAQTEGKQLMINSFMLLLFLLMLLLILVVMLLLLLLLFLILMLVVVVGLLLFVVLVV